MSTETIGPRLVDCCPEMQHISWTCKNHPNLRWFGKNCPGRSLFFDQHASWRNVAVAEGWQPTDEKDLSYYKYTGRVIEECTCPVADLVHIHEEVTNG